MAFKQWIVSLRVNACALIVYVVLSLTANTNLSAQVVRGVVTEKGSATPAPGVLISLIDEHGKPLANALSDADGSYELRAPAPGQFVLLIKRIGIQPFKSNLFVLAERETRNEPLVVERLVPALAAMRVTEKTACRLTRDGNQQLVSLWEDARAALTAAVVTASRHDKARVTRYSRDLDAESGRVLHDDRQTTVETLGQLFKSLPATQLEQEGFVVRRAENVVDYYAPDAEVLLSSDFLSTHCFRVVGAEGSRVGQVGLAFAPVRERRITDIRGTLWLDGKTFELRDLEFAYTSLPDGVKSESVAEPLGGNVRFLRLVDGRWIVDDWKIRMPLVAERPRPNRDARVLQLRHVGGRVEPLQQSTSTSRSTLETDVAGTVFDSATGLVAPNASVTLDGTQLSTRTGADGQFVLSGVPLGVYDLSLSTPLLDSLAVRLPPSRLEIKSTTRAVIRLAIPSWRARALTVCEDSLELTRDAIVRLYVIDAQSGAPVRKAGAVATWETFSKSVSSIGARTRELQAKLDGSGQTTLCGLPDGVLVRVASVRGDSLQWRDTLRVNAGALAVRVLRVRTVRNSATASMVGRAPNATIRGRITDRATGRAIVGALVRAVDGDSTRTSSTGAFRLAVPAPGNATVLVRRLGYRPATVDTLLESGDNVNLALALDRAPAELDTMRVRAPNAVAGRGVPELFEAHRVMGFGRFLAEDSLRARDAANTADVLRVLGGVRLVRLPAGGMAIASLIPPSPTLQRFIDRWATGGDVYQSACYMQVLLDGVRVWTWGEQPPVDVDGFPVNSLAAVEVYRSGAETPPEWGGTGASCGTIAFWSRRR